MLWYDGSKASLDDKIKAAMTYYQRKLNKLPRYCILNSKMREEGEVNIDKITIIYSKYPPYKDYFLLDFRKDFTKSK